MKNTATSTPNRADSRSPATAPAAASAAGVLVHGSAAEELAFGDGSSIWFLAAASHVGGALEAHRARLSPGLEAARPHHHRRTTEMIFVLEGAMELLLGEVLHTVRRGDLAVIPAGVTHGFRASESEGAEILDITVPGIERFDMFRRAHRVFRGLEPPATHPEDDARFDAYADESNAWNQAQPRVRKP